MTKKLDTDNNSEEICSVSAMARRLKLSRARFYQLLNDGVFPPPAYCIRTKRPLYPRNMQEQCLRIRRTGITASGHPVFFYAHRTKRPEVSQTRSNQRRQELMQTLEKMGLKVTQKQLEQAIAALYPQGLPKDANMGSVIRDLFRYVRQGV